MNKNQLLGALACCVLFAGSANAEMVFAGVMAGTNENPANGSPASGHTTVTIDDSLSLMSVHMVWSGLTGGPARDAHIHCCTNAGTNIGVAVGFSGFTATTSGTFDATFNLLNPAIYTTGFLNNFGGGTAAGARDALLLGLNGGRAYSNIHDVTFPGGEIRANLAPIPLPGAAVLLLSGLGLMGGLRRRRR